MDEEHAEKTEEIQSWAKLPEQTKWKRRKERVMNSWLFNEWTICVFVWVVMFVAGMTIERMYTNPTIRDLKIVERACGYENVKVRTVHELGIATAIFSCERAAQ